jgi:hypothetical protein
MNSDETAVILKRFEAPDEVRVLEKGRFELVHLGGMTSRFASARTSSISGSAPWAPVPMISRLPPQGISSSAESGV